MSEPISELKSPVSRPMEYALVDFGQGRKLERFGDFLLDRPSPPADFTPIGDPQAWEEHRVIYQRTDSTEGNWESPADLPPQWGIQVEGIHLRIKPTRFGHVGFFPEHLTHWPWLARLQQSVDRPLKVLHLFAYTGSTTLALARMGAEITHVDSAKNVVSWARQNATNSSLDQAPIRWLHEDARKFIRRELKREATYDGVILDPPTYGHGTKGEVWRIEKHLPRMLADLRKLVVPRNAFWLLTCHSPGFEAQKLRSCLTDDASLPRSGNLESGPMQLTTPAGRALPSGYFARWTDLPV
ncbi:MAG: class I SAM-dependent methyltransferase [Pirellulaceae bacterium]